MSSSIPHGEVLKVSQEVTHTEASARCFAGVGRSDSLLGCSDAVIINANVCHVVEKLANNISNAQLMYYSSNVRFPFLSLSFSFLQAINNLVEIKHCRGQKTYH